MASTDKQILAALRRANRQVAAAYPGDSGDRQPVHTVYGGAQLFRSDLAPKLGRLALAALTEHAPDARSFGKAFDLDVTNGFAAMVRARVADKLTREPVEDFRID